MRIVSFDIGVKHLAFVVVDIKGPVPFTPLADAVPKGPAPFKPLADAVPTADSSTDSLTAGGLRGQHAPFRVVQWELIDLCDDMQPDCMDLQRTCQQCSKTAKKFCAGDTYQYRCGVHGRGTEWQPLRTNKVKQVGTWELHLRLWNALQRHRDDMLPCDVVLIENQSVTRGHNRVANIMMKSVGNMIYSFFIQEHLQHGLPRQAVYVSAKDRFLVCQPLGYKKTFEKIPKKDRSKAYCQRKQDAETWTARILEQYDPIAFQTWNKFYRKHDLADAFLSALSYKGACCPLKPPASD